MNALEPAVAQLLAAFEVPDSPELVQTPQRVAGLWRENLLAGYAFDPQEILAERIPDPVGALVTVTGLPFHCVCPHHLLPAMGQVALAYEPGGFIVGLGVLERLVFGLSRRLVLQEQLTGDLVTALMEGLEAQGAACAISAQHLCLSLRGGGPREARVHTRFALGSLKGRPDVLPAVSG